MHTIRKRGCLLMLLALGCGLLSTVAFAQYDLGSLNVKQDSSNIVLTISPEHPKPNTVVTITVKSVVADLQSVTVAWLENGQLAGSGIGRTTHTTVTGKLGSEKTITVLIQVSGDTVYEKSLILKPASVDLLWETSSSVPPFYKGKALYSLLGGLKVIAVPEVVDGNGARMSPEQLRYTWTKNGTVLGKESGYGKSSLTFASPGFRMPITVKVDVATLDGIIVASDNISVYDAQPNVSLYENSPLYGILFNRAVGSSFTLIGKEIALESFPYFFNTLDRQQLSYIWSVNSLRAEEFQGPAITLRETQQGAGQAKLSLSVTNPHAFTEFASQAFTVSFGNEQQ